jgi:hypothetical protein
MVAGRTTIQQAEFFLQRLTFYPGAYTLNVQTPDILPIFVDTLNLEW